MYVNGCLNLVIQPTEKTIFFDYCCCVLWLVAYITQTSMSPQVGTDWSVNRCFTTPFHWTPFQMINRRSGCRLPVSRPEPWGFWLMLRAIKILRGTVDGSQQMLRAVWQTEAWIIASQVDQKSWEQCVWNSAVYQRHEQKSWNHMGSSPHCVWALAFYLCQVHFLNFLNIECTRLNNNMFCNHIVILQLICNFIWCFKIVSGVPIEEHCEHPNRKPNHQLPASAYCVTQPVCSSNTGAVACEHLEMRSFPTRLDSCPGPQGWNVWPRSQLSRPSTSSVGETVSRGAYENPSLSTPPCCHSAANSCRVWKGSFSHNNLPSLRMGKDLKK